MVKRIAYPAWCDIDVDPDDTQVEYQKYREALTVLLRGIGLVKPCTEHFLQRVYQEIDAV